MPSDTPSFGALREALTEHCARIVHEANVATEKHTHEQLVEAFRQAVLCGDFTRYIVVPGGAQTIIYLPYRRADELASRVKLLEDFIKSVDLWQTFQKL